MSVSPPIRRHSNASSRQEDLINAYEAEEERILNLLSRKLEQLREENINLENALEAESESHVNRLSRELTALRLAQHQSQQQQQQQSSANGSVSVSPENRVGLRYWMAGNSANPSTDMILDALKRENAELRTRLVETEQAFGRISRLNDIYREELIEHRRRIGIPIDNLIGLSSPDPLSQPTHHRSSSSVSAGYSPGASLLLHTGGPLTRPVPGGVPIPRRPSQIHRPVNQTSESNTPLSHSPSSSDSPFPFSPVTSTNPASYVSHQTAITSPPTSVSVNSNPPLAYGTPARGLTYPSVPPPSLSSSFGSPSMSTYMPHRDPSLSPVEPLSRRNSNARRGSFDWRLAESGSLRGIAQSRRGSIERGARIAETGTLIPRSRAGSQSLQSTVHEAPDSPTAEDRTGINIGHGTLDGGDESR
ncbi:hypothetical protein BDN72DRAFT_815499 [Pluteus cervinus]|uniref:Uncharacterized protein n=1 Tax=Pluteus cervinus TaxID=181527 RepID=A0ACD3B587_9AGAR|nr:hypothetical protein BDN72DRAFT_815499 [Pluteus cervinus]